MMITEAGFVLILFLKCEQTVLIIYSSLKKNTATCYLWIVGVGLGFRKIPHAKFLVQNLSYKIRIKLQNNTGSLGASWWNSFAATCNVNDITKDISTPFVLVLFC